MPKITIFDCDGHVAEPLDLWDRYVPARYRKQAKHTMSIRHMPGGGTGFYMYGKLLQGGTQAVTFAGKDPGTFLKNYWEEGEPSALDAKLRVKTLDSEGIAMSVLYPSFGGILGGVKDRTMAAVLSRAYNDWVVDWSREGNAKRIYGVAIVPMQFPDLAVKELRRAVNDLGLRAFMVRPNAYAGKHLDHPAFDPIWREAQALDVAAGFHPFPFPDVPGVNTFVGELERLPGTLSMMGDCAGLPMDNMLTMMRLTFGGVFDRFPKLRCAFLESNGSWAAMWVDRMEKRAKRTTRATSPLKTLPSEIVARQCFIALDGDEQALPYVAGLVGEDVIIWASDFPHFDGKFPGAAQEALEHSGPLGKRVQRKFLGENASRLYKIPLPNKN
jgi:predicted TIM-barrel fold metal-dependent hydrolase